MRNVYQRLQALMLDDCGMESMEWTILAALIVISLVTIVVGLGANVMTTFSSMETQTR